MSKIEKFEDLKVWQKSREINLKIYQLSNKGVFAKDFGLRDQIRRASVSILSNIAEGFERNGNKEFGQFLSVAKASAGEVRSQLYIAKDLEYVSDEEFTEVVNGLLEISKMINGLMSYLKTTEMKGSKFMEGSSSYGKIPL
ncbi:MAG: four helix bundle protein [Bacteroidia bacterium]|nr:four helix bundle protein [Bacteroidia bacterium]